ncbi:MAG: hypothetical protein HOH14_07475 [Gammaproteobacteria bacterium]|jgi:hypothetical protein|nr:hypothetical protein [Gammaproteobacteria bacterium]MBT6043318.1 hypothetical protein [Gammaproteobacteria bacterium]
MKISACIRAFLVPCILYLVSGAALAHHSFSMFDRETEMVLTGTVERWAFNNPHAWLYINVIDENGETVEWGFEGGAPPSLVRAGMTGRTFQPGDTVSVMFSPLVDGRPGGAICWIKVEDGSYKKPADGGCGARDPENISRWEKWLEMGFTSSKEAEAAAR